MTKYDRLLHVERSTEERKIEIKDEQIKLLERFLFLTGIRRP